MNNNLFSGRFLDGRKQYYPNNFSAQPETSFCWEQNFQTIPFSFKILSEQRRGVWKLKTIFLGRKRGEEVIKPLFLLRKRKSRGGSNRGSGDEILEVEETYLECQ